MGHATVQVWKSGRSHQDSIIPLWLGGFFLCPAFFCSSQACLPQTIPAFALSASWCSWTAYRISCHSVLMKCDGDLNQHSTHIHPIKPSWQGFLDQNSIVSAARRFSVHFCTLLFGELPPRRDWYQPLPWVSSELFPVALVRQRCRTVQNR